MTYITLVEKLIHMCLSMNHWVKAGVCVPGWVLNAFRRFEQLCNTDALNESSLTVWCIHYLHKKRWPWKKNAYGFCVHILHCECVFQDYIFLPYVTKSLKRRKKSERTIDRSWRYMFHKENKHLWLSTSCRLSLNPSTRGSCTFWVFWPAPPAWALWPSSSCHAQQ